MNYNLNTPSFNFVLTSVNPSILTPHPLLAELGYAYKSDPQFAKMMQVFGKYDSPVKDVNNNVFVHWLDVQAAVENNVSSIDCYTVDMTIEQLRQFILLKHKFHKKDLIASFNTVKFYETYLTESPEGIQLSASMEGHLIDKIAELMHTSDSTIKRLKRIGENKFEKLGLIEQGHTSFKQVIDEIKSERLAQRAGMRKAIHQTPSATTPVVEEDQNNNQEYYLEPSEAGNGQTGVAGNEEYYVQPAIDAAGATQTIGDEPYYDEPEGDAEDSTQATAKPLFEELNCVISAPGLGQFEITVSDNVPTVTVNGRELRNVSYMPTVDEKNAGNTAHSFIINQPGKNAFCIQLTIENIAKAA